MEKLFNEFIRERTFIYNVSPHTIVHYKQIYRAFDSTGAFKNLSKNSLSESLIALRERGVSIGALNTYISGINTFLNWLHTEKDYPKLSLKKMKGAVNVMRSLSDKEVKLLLNWTPVTKCDKRLKMLVLTILDTGIRIDEALTLERSKVDFDNLLMTVMGKGNKIRIIPFSLELRKSLYKFSQTHKEELIFCTFNGLKIHYCNVMRDFTIMTDSLGIKIKNSSFHALRRTFATNFIRRGGNPFILQRILGHSDISQTMHYVKLVTEDLQMASKGTSLLHHLR